MGGNHDAVELTWYGSDVRVTRHTFDLFGVGVHRENLVPAIPQFLEHRVSGDVRVPRDARNSDAVSAEGTVQLILGLLSSKTRFPAAP